MTRTVASPSNSKAGFKPESPIGAELKGAKGVTLQDLRITAAPATSPGASSFGMTAVNSDVVLKGGAAGQGGRLSADQGKWARDGSVGPAQDIYPKPRTL